MDYGTCGQGCYCDVPADAQPMNEVSQDEEFDWEFTYVQVTWMSRQQNTYFNSATGQPIAPQGHQHVEGPLQMNPGLALEMSWKLLTKYRATVKIKVKYTQYEVPGLCAEFPVEGGFPV
jgi:hypothetical protein